MLTPKLEELILCGKAFFKTAVIGGSSTNINIDNDRFIIITDITYLPYGNTNTTPNALYDVNTQLSIYGERGFNHYFFMNYRPVGQQVYDGGAVSSYDGKNTAQVQKIDCYLLHTTEVGFSFLVSSNLAGVSRSLNIKNWNNAAYQPPLDYGKEGMPGAVTIVSDITPGGMLNQVTNRGITKVPEGADVTQQIQYVASATTVPIVNNNPCFPIANINYVEILGQPNNIGI